MQPKWDRLDEDRKKKLINAALKEFSAKGYDEASTNIIAKESGLSKSLLFHYVGNKHDLFIALYEHTMKTILDDFFGSIDLTQKDMLARCRQIAFVKMELLHKYPALFDFFKTAIDTTAEDVKSDLDKLNKDFRVISFDRLFEGVDRTLFREDIDPDMAVNLCVWFLNGLGDTMQSKVSQLQMDEIDYDALTDESNQYFTIMRKCFYGGES